MESVCKGLSGMDAARAAMGHGRPFAAGPWSADGVNEPRARSARGRMSGAFSLCLLSLCAGRRSANKEKVRRRAWRNQRSGTEKSAEVWLADNAS